MTTGSSTNSDSKMIDLTIKTLDSQNHKFSVPDTFTILELKEFIAAQVNVGVVQQRLIFCGRVVSNETKLADIDIGGKVMHLVQKLPSLSTTTSGSSSSTTTNTTSHSRRNRFAIPLFATESPEDFVGALGVLSDLMHSGELPHVLSSQNNGNRSRGSVALDMIRRGNEILNRLEHLLPNPPQSSASNAEQYPEGSQQAEASSPSVPPEGVGAPESSLPESSSDPDTVNVNYEVDETSRNTNVVNGTSGLMRQVHKHMQTNNLFPIHQNATETSTEGEVSNVPVGGSTNQSLAVQASGTILSSASSEKHIRNDRQTSENISTVAEDYRQHFRELLGELNKLNERFRPFYAIYCQDIIDEPQFDTIEGEHLLLRVQSIFSGVSEVMHLISHVYHAISDMRIPYNRPPPRSSQFRPCLQQSTILHSAQSVSTTTTAAPPSTQQPTSTQTTTTSKSIPSVRAFRLDYGRGSETPNVSTSATETNTNTNMSVNPNTESNNTSTVTPQGVEHMFGLAPGSIHMGSIEGAYINQTESSTTGLSTVIFQPSATTARPTNTIDQVIDVITSRMRRTFMSEQSLDSNSIPTTATQTPRVTPRTTDSSSTTNHPLQARGRWDSTPHKDPFLPCSSHHFEPNIRPILRARRITQGTNRSTSSATSGHSTTDTASPTSNEEKSFTS